MGIIKCFLNRAWTICSTYNGFHNEVTNLLSIFSKNGYPDSLFYCILNKFMNKKFIDEENCNVEKIEFKYCMKIPFVGKISQKLKNDLQNLYKKEFKIDINCVFNSFKVSNYFSLKYKTPDSLAANIVYKFSCLNDSDTFYIGKTKRHFAVRVLEHLDLEKENCTAVADHIKICDFCKNGNISIDNFDILKKCRNDFESKINEAFYIQNLKPKLNSHLYNSGKSFLLNVYN